MLKHFGLPGLDSLVQQDFSKVRTLFLKLCTKGAFQAHAALTQDLNLGWRDGKSFSACQRTGLGRAVAEDDISCCREGEISRQFIVRWKLGRGG